MYTVTVSFKLDSDWIEHSDLIEEYVTNYELVGTGAGFGFRDMEFEGFETRDQVVSFASDLKETFPWIQEIVLND